MSHGLNFKLPDLIDFSHTLAQPNRADPDLDRKYADILRLRSGIPLMEIKIDDGKVDLCLEAHLIENKANDNVLRNLTPEQYFKLVQDLVCTGTALHKKEGVHGFELPPVNIITQNDAAGTETRKKIELQSVVVFDPKHFTRDEARDVFQMIFSTYGNMASSSGIIGNEFLQALHKHQIELSFNVKGYGIWTMTPKNFERDYDFNDENGRYYAKPDTTRFCMPVTESFSMPVNWGTFAVRNKGTIAARSEELPAIVAALEDIKDGRKTIQEALYETATTGQLVAKFDIYGMDPGFREANYDPETKPLLPDSQAALSRFRARADVKTLQ